jgi:hypothetical protein
LDDIVEPLVEKVSSSSYIIDVRCNVVLSEYSFSVIVESAEFRYFDEYASVVNEDVSSASDFDACFLE